jgi:AraC-like DNA-binding protein
MVQKRLNVEIFDKIYEEHYKGTPLSQLKAEYHTIRLISLLASDKQPDIKMLNCVTDDMEHNFSMTYNANKYADMLNISVDRFNHIFKDIMDISPMAYYNKLSANEILLPYTFGGQQGLRRKLTFSDAWVEMIRNNTVAILGWIQCEKVKWLQSNNPEVPGLIYKLSRPL